jgi:hypothetical protein
MSKISDKFKSIFLQIIKSKVLMVMLSLALIFAAVNWASVVILTGKINREIKEIRTSGMEAGVYEKDPVRYHSLMHEDYAGRYYKAALHLFDLPKGYKVFIRFFQNNRNTSDETLLQILKDNETVFRLVKEAGRRPDFGIEPYLGFLNRQKPGQCNNVLDMFRLAGISAYKIHYDWKQGNRQEAMELAASFFRLSRLMRTKSNLREGGFIQYVQALIPASLILEAIEAIDEDVGLARMDYSGVIEEIDKILADSDKELLYSLHGEVNISCIKYPKPDYIDGIPPGIVEELSLKEKIKEKILEIISKPMVLKNHLDDLRDARKLEKLLRENDNRTIAVELFEKKRCENYLIPTNRYVNYSKENIKRLEKLRAKLVEFDTSRKYSRFNVDDIECITIMDKKTI